MLDAVSPALSAGMMLELIAALIALMIYAIAELEAPVARWRARHAPALLEFFGLRPAAAPSRARYRGNAYTSRESTD